MRCGHAEDGTPTILPAGSVIAIVDPFSSGRFLAPAFRERGFRPIAVISAAEFGPDCFATFKPGDYDAILAESDAGFEDRLRTFQPAAVIAGGDEGVALADRLAPRYTPRLANDPGRAAARRHKGETVAALAAAGVAHPRTITTDDERCVDEWLATEGLRDAKLVLKPPQSAGSDGVALVEAHQDWRQPFARLRTWRDIQGVVAGEVVVQEFLSGRELAVDTLSVGGHHAMIGLFAYEKGTTTADFGVYRSVRLLSTGISEAHALRSYVFDVLDALGIRHGACHAEVMVTSRGPILVELNARLQGGCAPLMYTLAYGKSQVEWLVDLIVSGTLVQPPPQRCHVEALYLAAACDGWMTERDIEVELGSLPSLAAIELFFEPGARVSKTTDLLSAVGRVVLAHASTAQLEHDAALVRRIEKTLVEADHEGVAG